MAKLRPMMVLPPLVFFALAALLLWGVLFRQGDELPSAMRGKPAPMIPADLLGDYPPFVVEDLADGEIKLVNFWASWCAPCRVEHPNLQRLADQGLVIYGINYRDKDSQATAFLAELGSPYEGLVSDPEARAALQWGVYGVPETFIVDGEGRIVDRMAGPVTERNIARRLMPVLEAAGQTLQ